MNNDTVPGAVGYLLTLVHVVGTIGYASVMTMAPVIHVDLTITPRVVPYVGLLFCSGVALFQQNPCNRLGVTSSLAIASFVMALGSGCSQ